MILLKVIYDNDRENIIEDIENVIQYFKKKNIIMGISESIESNTHFVKIFCTTDPDKKVYNSFMINMAGIIYNILINEFYDKYLLNFLYDTYFFLKYDEIVEIMRTSKNILKGYDYVIDQNSIFCMNKKNIIVDKITDCIYENKEINIDGFITFRMKELKDDLESIIDKIVEQYIVEKEYNDFIKLLKYFIEIQDSKIDEINIIIENDGKYSLKDKSGNDITRRLFDDLNEIECKQGSNMEDILIGILITNCPNRIIIHGVENSKNNEAIDTIKNVFDDRVSICTSCKMCKNAGNSFQNLIDSEIKKNF